MKEVDTFKSGNTIATIKRGNLDSFGKLIRVIHNQLGVSRILIRDSQLISASRIQFNKVNYGVQIHHVDFQRILGKGVNMQFYTDNRDIQLLLSIKNKHAVDIVEAPLSNRYAISCNKNCIYLNYCPVKAPEDSIPDLTKADWSTEPQPFKDLKEFKAKAAAHHFDKLSVYEDKTFHQGLPVCSKCLESRPLALLKPNGFLNLNGIAADVSVFHYEDKYWLKTEFTFGIHMHITRYETLLEVPFCIETSKTGRSSRPTIITEQP
jgi:hypothetical protein